MEDQRPISLLRMAAIMVAVSEMFNSLQHECRTQEELDFAFNLLINSIDWKKGKVQEK